MDKQAVTFYKEYTWKKVIYRRFKYRVDRWYSYEESIKIWYIHKTEVFSDGRVCTKCWEYKHWIHFKKKGKGYKGYRADCIICQRLVIDTRRNKEEVKLKLYNYQKEYRKDKGKLQYELDSIYYRDKTLKKNREIKKEVGWLKIRNMKEIKLDKYYYFLNKGYDDKFLKKLYWIKNWDLI